MTKCTSFRIAIYLHFSLICLRFICKTCCSWEYKKWCDENDPMVGNGTVMKRLYVNIIIYHKIKHNKQHCTFSVSISTKSLKLIKPSALTKDHNICHRYCTLQIFWATCVIKRFDSMKVALYIKMKYPFVTTKRQCTTE